MCGEEDGLLRGGAVFPVHHTAAEDIWADGAIHTALVPHRKGYLEACGLSPATCDLGKSNGLIAFRIHAVPVALPILPLEMRTSEAHAAIAATLRW